MRSGRFGRADGVLEAAAAAAASGSSRSVDLLLRGLTTRLACGYEPALPSVAHALDVFQAEGFRHENIAWCWLACQLAMDLWNDDACAAIASGLATTARDRGALSVLPLALNYAASHQLYAGAFGVCEQLVREADAIATATSSVPIADFAVLLAAWRGDRERTYALREAAIAGGIERGEGLAVEVAEWALATLHLGYGEYAQAQAAAERGYDADGLGFGVWVLAELIEAAVRNRDTAAAELAFARLEERSSLSATPLARGIEARSRALLHDDDALYREAIEHLGRSKIVIHHARAHLIYGQWLRREGRRDDARAQLQAAHCALDAMGAAAFAERARRELAATGETVRKRRAGQNEARDALTPQEAQIARMARKGMTNPEIGARLFLSHRTVEWHLRKIFGKLGITSRRELADALPEREAELVPAP